MDPVVYDMFGVELGVGMEVRVHQEEEVTLAVIEEITSSPTKLQAGYWIDVERGEGLEGMPSYILEVI